MGFFDDLPPAPELHDPEPHREPWRGVPEDTHGAPLAFSAVVGHSTQGAILVTNVIAYPSGVAITVVGTSRLNPSPFMPGRGRPHAPFGGIRFGVGLADGSKVTHTFGPPSAEPAQYRLTMQGGIGGGRMQRISFWMEPLPPPGPMRFVCEWIEAGIEESSVELNAQHLIDAAQRAVPLWPEDQGLPEPPKPAGPPPPVGSGWTSTIGSAISEMRPKAPGSG